MDLYSEADEESEHTEGKLIGAKISKTRCDRHVPLVAGQNGKSRDPRFPSPCKRIGISNAKRYRMRNREHSPR